MKHACMMSKSIDILRSRRPHAFETVESVARDRGPSADSHAVPARAAPLRAAPAETRCRAVHPYGPRPHGPHRRRCGRHRQPLVSRREPKSSIFAPRRERHLQPRRRQVDVHLAVCVVELARRYRSVRAVPPPHAPPTPRCTARAKACRSPPPGLAPLRQVDVQLLSKVEPAQKPSPRPWGGCRERVAEVRL